MSIIVEDGTAKTDSETYISVADADAYFAARGVTAWDALDNTDQKEPALRLATEFMTQEYRSRWKGVRLEETQALDWPRQGVVLDSWSVGTDEVPVEVQRACAELAYRSTTETLSPDLTQAVISEKVDVIQVVYDRYSPQQKRFSSIEKMLSPLFQAGGGASIGLIRT